MSRCCDPVVILVAAAVLIAPVLLGTDRGECFAAGGLRRNDNADPAINMIVDRFNAEIGKKYPDFTSLDEMIKELKTLDRDKADEARPILNERAVDVADEAVYAIENALQKGDASTARYQVDYCSKHQRVMGIPFEKIVALEERVRQLSSAGDKESVIDRDLKKARLLLSEYKFGETRQVMSLINHNFEKLKPALSKSQRKEMTGKITGLTTDISRGEDSVINVSLTVLKTQGMQAAIEYRERMLIRTRADRSKLDGLDEAIFRAQSSEKEREDSIRVAEESKAVQARLERDRLERERSERQKAEEKRLADERRRQDELARVEQARAEQERIKREADERKRQDAELRERERLERERTAREQAEKARLERERLAQERAEQARVEAERQRAQQQAKIEEARRKGEEKEAARLERERVAQEQAERARLDAVRQEQEQQARLEEEQRRREEQERELSQRKQSQQARLDAQRLESERLERERSEQARIEAERREQERVRLESQRQEQERQARGTTKRGKQQSSAPALAASPQISSAGVPAAPAAAGGKLPAYQTKEYQIMAQQKAIELYTKLENNEIITARALYQKDRQFLKMYMDPEAFTALEFSLFPETTRRSAQSAAQQGSGSQSGGDIREQISKIYLLLERNDVGTAYSNFQTFIKPMRNSMNPAEYSQLETIVTRAYTSASKR